MNSAKFVQQRPRIPPMNSTGMNTAMSEIVIDTMVKEISFEPSRVACHGLLPISDVAA